MKRLRINYLGKKYLEQCKQITIKEIIKKVEYRIKDEILNMELDWIEIEKTTTNYWWFRLWFKCPMCNNKVFKLYEINWNLICRICSWLPYKKQKYKGMIEWKI